ncbi:MAG TPA: UDP-N-acetylmuramoyl-L-alanyl-D-glutamate--2,6-diaminopimelate ligase [Tepidisphaeraceae bacterium]|nr:UDP-N-acetylmuramoyl-L-alanyl-D-glutamate--2,6-diaminopimelate ligase [Tepidisphaeraceae bacterium]
MLLHTLLRQMDPATSLDGVPNVHVTAVREDSRQVQVGDLFVARAGVKTDGAAFAMDAGRRGAVAVVTQKRIEGCSLPQVIVADAAGAASRLANLRVGEPSSVVKVVGITGTNGKTTTAYLIRHILAKVGKKCGLIGTVEIDDGKDCWEAEMTTPGGAEVAELLGAMRDNGCKGAAMEVSSHALDQGRVAGVKFAGAGFSNLTGDHLDYHGTMELYAAAKARLFEGLAEDAAAVVNAHDEWAWRMVRDCGGRVARFGFSNGCDYRAADYKIAADGSHFILHTPDGRAEVHMALVGRHNIENALMAAGLCCETFGLSVHQVAAGLKDALGAPGRLQPVRCGQPFAVLVDYAHSDDALRNVLTALRPLCKGRLRVLFGCGGDRDRTKRPRMARLAQELADDVWVTSDNPRTESPELIIGQIRAGFVAGGRGQVIEELDRRAAIAGIIESAEPGDVVLIAGKGHENYQIIGTEKRHFDDAEEATRAIKSRAAAVK